MQKDKQSQHQVECRDDSNKRTLLGQSQIIRIIVFEVLGTFILTFGILCSKYSPPLQKKILNPFHDISISLALYLAIIFAAPFSGGHFNPAVSIGLFLYNKTNRQIKKLACYIISQFLGSILAIVLARALYQCQIVPYQNTVSIIRLTRDSVGEFVGGFLFIYLILTVTNSQTTFIYQTAWIHIFIPIALFASRCLSYYVGGLNPAVVLSFQLFAIINNKQIEPITLLQTLVVQLMCTAGAIVGCVFYKNIYKPSFIKYE